MIKLICKQCGHDFYVIKSREKTAKFCCKKCYGEWEKGENNPNWQGGPIIIYCDWCGEEIERCKGSIYKTNFCNQKCSGKWKSENYKGENGPTYNGGPITLICEWCGHEYTRNESAVEGSHFCCQDCYSEWQSINRCGENSYQWDGGPITLICEWCGHEYTTHKSAVENSRFCSNECLYESLSKDPEHAKKISAGSQGIPYDEWENFASKKLYCPDYNEECKESNREKYGRMCFLTGLPESENIDKNGKQWKLATHHYDMDKGQGCNGKKWKLVPLCMKWHGKVHNKLWEARIIWLLDNVWKNNDYRY